MNKSPTAPRKRRSPKAQADLTREQARAFRIEMHRQAGERGLRIDDYRLEVGRKNDIYPDGKGPRFNIVAFSQMKASEGALYKDVLGQVVLKGDGGSYQIRERDLLGYVCANGYCRLVSPDEPRS